MARLTNNSSIMHFLLLLCCVSVVRMSHDDLMRRSVLQPGGVQLRQSIGKRSRGRPQQMWGPSVQAYAVKAAGGIEALALTAQDEKSRTISPSIAERPHGTPLQDASMSQRLQHWPFSCDGLWAGKLPLNTPPRVNFVVAYCKTSLLDVTKVIDKVKALNVTVGSIDIYAKCGQAPDVHPTAAVVHHLPNVGGNDHTYAYHMAHLSSRNDLAPEDVIVFLKDTVSNFHQYLQQRGNVSEAILMAAGPAGFGCFTDPLSDISAFAKSSALSEFAFPESAVYHTINGVPFKSPYRNLKSWLTEALSADLPTPATPVCYGGNFVAKLRNIMKNTRVWTALARSLERATSLEEGHFAERSWAGLLMDISQIDLGNVMCAARKVFDMYDVSYYGILQGCDSGKCRSPEH
mmetsp:Transcript_85409/g.164440  ORF Transcript_85409/g.164440 Transcript_85409/m.164440 type:complete len:404 (+) Transcript_85409:81-1292(+)